jgi:hypothetical protein
LVKYFQTLPVSNILWGLRVRVMVFNATFNNILVTLWSSDLLVEETGVPGKKNTDLPEVVDILYHIMLYRVHLTWAGFKLTTLVVIGNDYTGSCKSNYNTIRTTTAPSISEHVSFTQVFFNSYIQNKIVKLVFNGHRLD